MQKKTMSRLTIVMYHYVRKIKESRYPAIKGLEFEGFQRQLDYLSERYHMISAEQLIAQATGGEPIPDGSCYLTFDDGYKDHIRYVLPELSKRGLQGSFFPPVKPVAEREMLDVNRIHFILASSQDDLALVRELNALCIDHGIAHTVLEEYWKTHALPDRFDTAEVIYVKRMLQHVLPEHLRNTIAAILFEKFVAISEREFADELYLSTDDTKTLVEQGMYVGSHGYRHLWLNTETLESQASEIDASLAFLSQVGAPTKDWIMCYPYGAYNSDTLDILRARHCAVGLTTKVELAELKTERMLELPRLDTNDFPR
jgi:peptidoglycan/xylan/chitin deacetylase (PgdA/CDA1 family)